MTMRGMSTLEKLRPTLAANPELVRACRALARIAHWPVSQQTVIDALSGVTGEHDTKPMAAVLMATLVEVGVLCWLSGETAHLDQTSHRLLQQLGFRTRRRNRGTKSDHSRDVADVLPLPLPDRIEALAVDQTAEPVIARPEFSQYLRHDGAITPFSQRDIDNFTAVVNAAEKKPGMKWPLSGMQLAELIAQAIGEESYDPRPRTYRMMEQLVEWDIVAKPSGADWYWKGPSWPKPNK